MRPIMSIYYRLLWENIVEPRLIRTFILFYMSWDLSDKKVPLDSHRLTLLLHVWAIRGIQLAQSANYTMETILENFDSLNIFFIDNYYNATFIQALLYLQFYYS